MRDLDQTPWLQKARLPLSIVGALSALILALNFSLDLLSLLNIQWEHQLLLLILLICLAGWALAEVLVLHLQRSPGEPLLNSLKTLLIVQLVVQCARLGLFFLGSSITVDKTYGIRVVELGLIFVFLPVYLVVFLLVGRALIMNYVAEIKSAYRKLQNSSQALTKLATTDPLTGAFNRRHFEERVEVEASRTLRHGTPLSLIIFDIDYFKKINDRFGHHSGDEVLVRLTELTLQNLRASDVLARWGGEEFIILLPQSDAKEAQKVAEKLRLSMAEQVFGEVGHLTCSFGVAEVVPGAPLTSWVNRADQALYQAKNSGRNTVCVADLRLG
ncbi:diguanylate cyclase [Marinobacter sp. 2_MG-2023]|nr:GGDEF domain-containing protein [Marinobacter sp. 2_MG-2023]MDO6442933.1 GGDEF domain-containing protein [Marinobacter sp. 2_MG-2023]